MIECNVLYLIFENIVYILYYVVYYVIIMKYLKDRILKWFNVSTSSMNLTFIFLIPAYIPSFSLF